MGLPMEFHIVVFYMHLVRLVLLRGDIDVVYSSCSSHIGRHLHNYALLRLLLLLSRLGSLSLGRIIASLQESVAGVDPLGLLLV